jgi:trehalose-6-phosphate synthase
MWGFHIPRYAANFVSVARSLFDVDPVTRNRSRSKWMSEGTALMERTMPGASAFNGRDVSVSVTPGGRRRGLYRGERALRRGGARTAQIREELGDTKLILSVGRTDYTKGGIEQLASFERVLEANPELLGKVRLMHVSVAANRNMTVYENIQSEIEADGGPDQRPLRHARLAAHHADLAGDPLRGTGVLLPLPMSRGSRRWPTA